MFNDIITNQSPPRFVFLGGTVNRKWRDDVIPKLSGEYFNPVVDDWKPEDMEKEIAARKRASCVLYVFTPKMTGVYAVAELIDDSHRRSASTVFYFQIKDGNSQFDDKQIRSLEQVGKMVETNGGKWCKTFDEMIDEVNRRIS